MWRELIALDVCLFVVATAVYVLVLPCFARLGMWRRFNCKLVIVLAYTQFLSVFSIFNLE